jgi:hypothetical protein
MLRPAEVDLNVEIDRLSHSLPTGQTSTATDKITREGTLSFKGLGGERAACEQLLFSITGSHVSLTSIDKTSTSIIFPEGFISYTVSGTATEIASFRRLIGGQLLS